MARLMLEGISPLGREKKKHNQTPDPDISLCQEQCFSYMIFFLHTYREVATLKANPESAAGPNKNPFATTA